MSLVTASTARAARPRSLRPGGGLSARPCPRTHRTPRRGQITLFLCRRSA
ncbi:hypothetical protein Salmuc_02813 [Salipiger mucosus DSM 16094]|uniref:Uncharacterized protein n=1 Tax=Salipiger mucosus DSM 16094 TaxID=1123237 RepID=S9R0M3_9RHOB|nr:hypothetical protein Salmuc_02813 [Salipiger mucosus DSM 16094]